MINIWEKTFKKKKWGEYPPEDLIRFIRRLKFKKKKSKIKILELGCGPGANVKFLIKEGFNVYGIDISKTAIQKARSKISKIKSKNFIVGNFKNIPWPDSYFDGVIDNFSLYANELKDIKRTYKEIHRVLKAKGFFFSKVWGTKTQGFQRGIKLEKNTFKDINIGPCKNLGISHFFTLNELTDLNSIFSNNTIDINNYTDKKISKNYFAQVYISQSIK